jgi:hypothetical protein
VTSDRRRHGVAARITSGLLDRRFAAVQREDVAGLAVHAMVSDESVNEGDDDRLVFGSP